jgi:phage FluMu protein gp41
MPATVDATSDAERETDAEAAAEKSAITRNYEAMLAALNGLLAEMREERRQAEVSGNVVDAKHNQEPATAQHSVWAEAHAALSQK